MRVSGLILFNQSALLFFPKRTFIINHMHSSRSPLGINGQPRRCLQRDQQLPLSIETVIVGQADILTGQGACLDVGWDGEVEVGREIGCNEW